MSPAGLQPSTEVVPGAPADGCPSLRIASAAEAVEAGERVFRQVFAAGLLVAMTMSLGLGAVFLATGAARTAFGATVVAVVLAAGATRGDDAYALIRRRPALLLAVGVALGTLAAATTVEGGDLMMASVAVPLAILGTAAGLRHVVLAAVLAALCYGLTASFHDLDGDHTYSRLINGTMIAVLPPLFRLLVERLARFVLHVHEILEGVADATAAAHHAAYSASASTMDRTGVRSSNELAIRRSPRARTGPRETDAAGAECAGAGPEVDVVVTGRATDVGAPDPPRRNRLTVRQTQAVLLATEGLRHAEIAACLGVSTAQVRRLLDGARRRTGSRSTQQLVRWALDAGIVPRPGGAPTPGGSVDEG